MRSGSYIKAMGDEDSGDSDTSPKPSPKVAARRESYLKATQPSLTELTTLKWVTLPARFPQSALVLAPTIRLVASCCGAESIPQIQGVMTGLLMLTLDLTCKYYCHQRQRNTGGLLTLKDNQNAFGGNAFSSQWTGPCTPFGNLFFSH